MKINEADPYPLHIISAREKFYNLKKQMCENRGLKVWGYRSLCEESFGQKKEPTIVGSQEKE